MTSTHSSLAHHAIVIHSARRLHLPGGHVAVLCTHADDDECKRRQQGDNDDRISYDFVHPFLHFNLLICLVFHYFPDSTHSEL